MKDWIDKPIRRDLYNKISEIDSRLKAIEKEVFSDKSIVIGPPIADFFDSDGNSNLKLTNDDMTFVLKGEDDER